MSENAGKGALLGFLVVSLLLTILVIPGVGLETRNLSSFPSWQQLLFMDGGPIVLVLNVLAIGLTAWRARAGAGLAILVGLATLALSSVGLGGFGAPTVPTALVVIEVLHILAALGLIVVGAKALRRPAPLPPAPPAAPAV